MEICRNAVQCGRQASLQACPKNYVRSLLLSCTKDMINLFIVSKRLQQKYKEYF